MRPRRAIWHAKCNAAAATTRMGGVHGQNMMVNAYMKLSQMLIKEKADA